MGHSIIEKALSEVYQSEMSEIESVPDHKFSLRFRRNMKKELQSPETLKKHASGKSSAGVFRTKKMFRIALIAALIMAFLTACASTVRYVYERFVREEHATYSMMRAIEDENAPTEILEKYDIGYDMSGYERTVLEDDETGRTIEYDKGDVFVVFGQDVKCNYTNVRLNTENATVIESYVKDDQAICLKREDGYGITWDNGSYILTVWGNLPEEEMMAIANSVCIKKKKKINFF